MNVSITAKYYQLMHGHNLHGISFHGNTQAMFKYGLINANRIKTTYTHGIESNQNSVEIETVEPLDLNVGDKIQLADGKRGKVADVSTTLLDDVQLRFVSYERADKVKRITVRFV